MVLICRGERVLLDVRGRAEGAGRVRRAGVRGDGYPRGGDTAYRQKIWCRRIKRGAVRVCLLFGVASARTGLVFPASPSSRRWRAWMHRGSDGRSGLAFSARFAGPRKTCSSSSSAECATFPSAEVAPAHRYTLMPAWWGCSNPEEPGDSECHLTPAANGETEAGTSALGMLPRWHHTCRGNAACRGVPPKLQPIAAGRVAAQEPVGKQAAVCRQAAPDCSTVPGQPHSPQGSLSPRSRRPSSAQAGQPRLTAPCRESEPKLHYQAPGSAGEGRC